MKKILVINSGSSSLKFKLFNSSNLKEEFSGVVERIGLPNSFIDYQAGKKKHKNSVRVHDHQSAVKAVLQVLAENKIELNQIEKIGHRVVHGGEKFTKPTLIDYKNFKNLEVYNDLAPLHNPHNLSGIGACLKAFPQAKNYAVFDTAFHMTMPDYAYLYPLPYRFYKDYAIRRYGFHGISHEYVSTEAAKKLKKNKCNLITCHLGSGCSITAIKNGISVDTSMGFTPLEGLMMSTRTGDIDPAIIFYLLKEGMTIKEINDLFNFKSGLLGVSGLKDMRDILLASGYSVSGYKSLKKFNATEKKLARLALKMFVYRVIKYIGSYMAVLGKVDAIVFTAGIGERNQDIRNFIVKGLPIKPKVLVIPTNEELMIAKQIK